LKRQTTPRTKHTSVRNTDAVAMMLKNLHVTKVHRKVVEKNMTPHPPRYRNDSIKKINIGALSSRRTANHPWCR
jgi:hypothetical protein